MSPSSGAAGLPPRLIGTGSRRGVAVVSTTVQTNGRICQAQTSPPGRSRGRAPCSRASDTGRCACPACPPGSSRGGNSLMGSGRRRPSDPDRLAGCGSRPTPEDGPDVGAGVYSARALPSLVGPFSSLWRSGWSGMAALHPLGKGKICRQHLTRIGRKKLSKSKRLLQTEVEVVVAPLPDGALLVARLGDVGPEALQGSLQLGVVPFSISGG